MENKIEITQELLQTIYDRAYQYAITVQDPKHFDDIVLSADGTLIAKYSHYTRGDTEYFNEVITVENLTEDLDEVSRKRKEQEEEERKVREARRQKEEIEKKAREVAERKQQYLRLKKEFE